MTLVESIARQERDKKRLASIIRCKLPALQKRKVVTKAHLNEAVRQALEGVARGLRFKAKETPKWAPAYHSACSEIEKEIAKWNG